MVFITKELSPELPRPVAAPVDTYVRPAPSQLGEFVRGLSGLTGQAMQAAFNADAPDKKEQTKQEQLARLKAVSATPAQLRDEIKNGNYFGMPMERSQIAMRVMDAKNRVMDVSKQLEEMQSRGELSGPDAQQRIAQVTAAASQDITDPLAAKAFSDGIMPVMSRAGVVTTHNAIQQNEDNKSATLFGYLRSHSEQVAKDAAANKFTPEQATEAHKKAIFAASDYAKNHLLMPPQAIEKVLEKEAQEQANLGNAAALDALGAYDRNGAPLRDKLGAHWQQLTLHAKAVQDGVRKEAAHKAVDTLDAAALRADEAPEAYYKRVDEARKADPDNFSEARAERLKMDFDQRLASKQKEAVKQMSAQELKDHERALVEAGAQQLIAGRGYLLPDESSFETADGKQHTFEHKKLASKRYEHAEALIDKQGEEEQWTPERVQREKLMIYGRNGSVHPRLQASFNDLFNASSSGVTPSPEDLKERLEQLEFVRSNDKSQFNNLSARHSSTPGRMNRQELWLQTYNAARDYGSEPGTAYSLANQRVFAPGAMDRATAKDSDEKVDAVMKELGVTGTLARQKVHDAVDLQLAAGVPMQDLKERASEYVKATHVFVNGVPATNQIPGVADPMVAGEYLADAAEFFKESNKGLKKQKFDVAFTDDPQHPGHYIAVRTDTMERISRAGKSGSEIKSFVLQWRDFYSKNPSMRPSRTFMDAVRRAPNSSLYNERQ